MKPLVIRFTFGDFENVPYQPGDSNLSKVVTSGGTDWQLQLFPGGEVAGSNVDGIAIDNSQIGVFLKNITGVDINATIAVTVRDAAGNAYYHYGDNDIGCFKIDGFGTGYHNLVKRSEIVDKTKNILLDDGTLIVDVELQKVDGPNQFQPSNPFADNMLKLLENEDESDISFKVGDVIFPAHKLILKMNAPTLFCEKHDGGSPIPIGDSNLEVFRHVLCYIYGGGKPKSNEMRKMGKDLIDAADRYGVVGLKLAVETALVELRVLNVENVVEWILFADARTCPLLKEYATAYFAGRVKDVLAHESSKGLDESPKLTRELMLAISNDPNNCIDDTSKMTVDELRMKLNEEGLDVDGSKAVLVSRLGESNKNKRRRTE